ncbi:RNA methyltransferase [Psychrobacter sanguinis]|uniref:TrmH family RNA methyltransferase n=1 Tax=Psychrobacter sanguinis TaxID=861445 RepID=UPI001919A695|nr:RNA methyltransferase [Psychrobacter sanguinis]MCD9152730.1 RNA methyltransferase [Psychrobacter sanguinis]MDY3306267.1 RNA methyltransferase [Psychrobacter sanguinis]
MSKVEKNNKSKLRERADNIKQFQCKNLIAVLENPNDSKNLATAIRNVNALGVEKLYVVDSRKLFPDDWEQLRQRKSLLKPSVSAIKWTFVKVFSSTEECLDHLEKYRYTSIVTSPHIKGQNNVLLQDGDYTQKRLAVWFGNESRGISEIAIKRSEACVQIEMAGMIESLNLATSTGIVLYEVTKQRRAYQQQNKRGRRVDPPVVQYDS